MFWPGKMRIDIPKDNFLSNEQIIGTVFLELDKPISARGVRIAFIGERGSGKHRRRVHEDTLTLDQSTEYQAGTKTYSFSFNFPIYQKFDTSGFGFLKGLADLFVTQDLYRYTDWWLDASLDIPNALDVNTTKRIYAKAAPTIEFSAPLTRQDFQTPRSGF
ncbi:hypothetical protein HY990_07435 [Candidatus Micrarchaeota archaeon]|nr:hypothetical protein [Candidatus Micrarchaeota archaeon]